VAEPRSAIGRERILAALASKRSLVVARAANLVKQHRLEDFADALKAAFARFLVDPVKTDPSCPAKLAAIEALDFTDWMDDEPFLTAARHIQLEPAWGPPVDTAAGLRSRAVLALARVGYADLQLLAGELLGDAEPPVRLAALEALALRGARDGAGLARYKMQLGDGDPLVTLAAMNALVQLAPDWALPLLGRLLDGKDENQRELAANALGQSRSDEALGLLLAALERTALSSDREPLYRAIGLHRSDRALDALLAVIEDGSAADAKAAVAGLGARRFEPGLPARVRAAAKRNDRVDLGAAIDEAFE
jgi:HEAT repeat protein